MKRLVALLMALLLLAATAGAETYLLADIGEEAEATSSTYDDDGSYSEAYVLDGVLDVHLGRYAPDDEEADMPRLLLPQTDGARRVEMPPVGGYAAERYEKAVDAKDGSAHNAHFAFILTDEWIYFATIRVPMALAGDYAGEIERIFASLAIEDDAGAATGPFDWADIEDCLLLPFESETDTLAELVALLDAEWFTWEAGADGALLSLTSDFGSVDVWVADVGDLLSAERGLEGGADLPRELLARSGGYAFRSARWDSPDYALPGVRGLRLGDFMAAAAESLGGEIEAIGGESGFSELLTCSLHREAGDDAPAESAELRVYGSDGAIAFMHLSYEAE